MHDRIFDRRPLKTIGLLRYTVHRLIKYLDYYQQTEKLQLNTPHYSQIPIKAGGVNQR
jgi:hypothetical protein